MLVYFTSVIFVYFKHDIFANVHLLAFIYIIKADVCVFVDTTMFQL